MSIESVHSFDEAFKKAFDRANNHVNELRLFAYTTEEMVGSIQRLYSSYGYTVRCCKILVHKFRAGERITHFSALNDRLHRCINTWSCLEKDGVIKSKPQIVAYDDRPMHYLAIFDSLVYVEGKFGYDDDRVLGDKFTPPSLRARTKNKLSGFSWL